MEEKVISFFRRNPKLFAKILEFENSFIPYEVNFNSTFLKRVEPITMDFTFIHKHESKIKKYFWDKFNKEITINLIAEIPFSEIEQIRIDHLIDLVRNKSNDGFRESVKWSQESCSLGPWSIKIIELYKDNWKWGDLSRNQFLKLDKHFIEYFSENWDWKNGLSWHRYLPKDLEFCISNWRKFSFVRSIIPEEELDKFIYEFTSDELSELSQNVNIKWKSDYIRKCYLNESKFKKYSHGSSRTSLSTNPSLPWDYNFIKEFENYWFWGGLSRNKGIPWTNELIEMYFDKWDWNDLSDNSSLPWSHDFIRKYKTCLNFRNLSRNEGIPWNISLINEFENLWEWDLLSQLKTFPLSKALLEKYGNRIKWLGEMTSNKEGDLSYTNPPIIRNKNFFLDENTITYFRSKWKLDPIDKYGSRHIGEWNEISYYSTLNLDLVDKYFELFDPKYLIDNFSIQSFALIEIIEKNLGPEKFMTFLNNYTGCSYNGLVSKPLSNTEKLWQNVLRFHLDEEVLLGVIKD